LINELEISISNISASTINSFRKFDLLIFSDDIVNSKLFSYFSFKTPFFIFYCANNQPTEKLGEFIVDAENIDQKVIVQKIISFAKEP
jgi:hypothetical protein